MTPPFHPILPHLHRQEREALFDMMIDFDTPRMQHANDLSIGLWLPEAAYSRETIDSFRESVREASLEQESLAESLRGTYLIVDARQFIRPPEPGRAWVHVESTNGLLAIARDHSLSGEFAFGSTTASEFGGSVQSRGTGSLLVRSALVSLIANPNPVERFEGSIR